MHSKKEEKKRFFVTFGFVNSSLLQSDWIFKKFDSCILWLKISIKLFLNTQFVIYFHLFF